LVTRAHHTAIVVVDVAQSLRFWRDCIGFETLMDHEFDGAWTTLFDAPGDRLRSVFLGDPAYPDAGIVELVQFVGDTQPSFGPATPPRNGFFLVSCYVDVDAVLARLQAARLGGTPRRITVSGAGAEVQMATVVDPDGVLVELIGMPAG
jgi:glyoxylase I family protein